MAAITAGNSVVVPYKYNFLRMNVNLIDRFPVIFGYRSGSEAKLCDEFTLDLRSASLGGAGVPITGDESPAIQ